VIVCKTGAQTTNQQPAPAPSPTASNGGVQVGTCSSQDQCASKCAAVTPGKGVAPTKRDTEQSQLLSSKCEGDTCTCTFDKVPESLKNLPKGNGGGGSGFCFPAEATVTTPTGPMRMDELKVGHQVMVMNEATGQTGFERVDSFIHRRPDIVTEFYRLKTGAGSSLTLSPEHLVPVVDCANPSAPTTLKYARDTAVGQCLLVNVDGHLRPSDIQSIDQVTETGIFAPLTQSGNLMVGDVIASCYSAHEGYLVQNSFYRIYSNVNNWLFGTAVEGLNPMDAPPVLHLFETINSA